MPEYRDKTPEQEQIDRDCGCDCHAGNTSKQNHYWCGYCEDNHQDDERYNNTNANIYESIKV